MVRRLQVRSRVARTSKSTSYAMHSSSLSLSNYLPLSSHLRHVWFTVYLLASMLLHSSKQHAFPPLQDQSHEADVQYPAVTLPGQYVLMEKPGSWNFDTMYKVMHNETMEIVAIQHIGVLLAPVTLAITFALNPPPPRSSRSPPSPNTVLTGAPSHTSIRTYGPTSWCTRGARRPKHRPLSSC